MVAVGQKWRAKTAQNLVGRWRAHSMPHYELGHEEDLASQLNRGCRATR